MFKNIDIEAAQYEVSEWESQHGLKLTSRAYKDLVDLVLAAQLTARADKPEEESITKHWLDGFAGIKVQ